MENNDFNPDYKVSPSSYIQELAAYFISIQTNKNDFTKYVDPEILLELIRGDRKIGEEEACLLGRTFNVSKEVWVSIQKDYDRE